MPRRKVKHIYTNFVTCAMVQDMEQMLCPVFTTGIRQTVWGTVAPTLSALQDPLAYLHHAQDLYVPCTQLTTVVKPPYAFHQLLVCICCKCISCYGS